MRGYKSLVVAHWSLVVVFLLAIAFVGCEKKEFTSKPAKMHWDRDMCERCKMAISERKFAVQAIDTQNKVHKFDDIGCFVLWKKEDAPNLTIKKVWIPDFETGKWIDAKRAYYTHGVISPMGFGFAAHEKKPDKKYYTYEETKKMIEQMKRMKKKMHQ